jgi:hypothetical protein
MRAGLKAALSRGSLSKTGLPTAAVITMTRDEGSMLARWVDFYGDAVGRENLLVLDDNSSDGSTKDLGCTVFRLPQLPGRGGYERTRMNLLSGFAEGLLECYDFVIFVDVDEFLIPDPERYGSLREFLAARRNTQVIAPMTLNLVHHVGVEPDLDPDRPILEQRGFAKFVPVMCKPAIKQVPARWRKASHGILAPFAVDRELFMLHLKFYDRTHLQAMASKRYATAQIDGRADKSNWHRGVDELTGALDQVADSAGGRDPSSVPVFDPTSADLGGIVRQMDDGLFRTTGPGQLQVMCDGPLYRVPPRLIGRL